MLRNVQPPQQGKALEWEWGAAMEAVVILLAALVVAAGGAVVHCGEYGSCNDAKACLNASRTRPLGMSCSFTNFVTVAGDVLYGDIDAPGYVALTRGVCAPGERVHQRSTSGLAECVPWRSWPSALNEEIMEPTATSRHDQACGRWIQAGPTWPTEVEYWSLYGGERAAAAVRKAEVAAYASAGLTSGDIGKFYAACRHTVLGGSGAIRASAKQAYAHLAAGLDDLTTERRVLEAAGWIASHHCDGPVSIGTTIDGDAFAATSYRGSSFSHGSLAEALYAVDEPRSMQDLAEHGNALLDANAMSSPEINTRQLKYVYNGATGRTSPQEDAPLRTEVTPELGGLVWLATQPRFAEARGYLHGVAAMCAFALQGGLDMRAASEWSARGKDLRRLRSQRPRAAALGRLHMGHDALALTSEPTNNTAVEASSVTFSQLQAQPRGDPAVDCPAMISFLFPDRLDHKRFDLVVTSRLYDRVQELTATMRASVAHVVRSETSIKDALQEWEVVAQSVEQTIVRIAGAPRGTWAGIQRQIADGRLTSGDGPMLMALKQSRAVFMDRMETLVEDASVCSGPLLYDALATNAYIYPGAACSYILLGMLRKPFADERYDNASLATRVGYTIAHELAHNTINSEWNTTATDTLLQRYTSNLHSEAMADVVAAMAIVHSGLATAAEACSHISQFWCARVPMRYEHPGTELHPAPNERGDLLCQTLVDLGLL
jgi:hypothetical protein